MTPAPIPEPWGSARRDAALEHPLEMHPVTRSSSLFAVRHVALAAASLAAVHLTGCSTISNAISGDKVDYRTSSSSGKTAGLEVPPDLTQLSKDSRYQQTGGSVSAASFQAGPAAAVAAAPTTPNVAPQSLGAASIERQGSDRWLHTSLAPDQLWPQLQAFWKERGFVIVQDTPVTGVMETDWAENRAKLPQDFIRASIGKVFDNAYSTGELDKFRTRVERGPDGGSDVFITHRGMVETVTGQAKDSTVWQPRPADPQLEAEFLSRLMVKLGAKEETAKAQVEATAATPGVPGAPGAPARARIVTGQPAATLQVDDGFDRAWRRVGVALDRSGFTVEDRDRTQGIYFVRYIDPKFAGKEEPNFFSKLFSFGKKDDASGPTRYRVVVKSEANSSTVTVLNGQGAPENGDAGQRITKLLLEDLK
jgi:outer membrane protein assembly factor BamC